MQGITKRQADVLSYIREQIEERGFPPTLREIGRHLGIGSTNGVNDHLIALERKGYIRRDSMQSRAIQIVENDAKKSEKKPAKSDIVSIPIVSEVMARDPLGCGPSLVDELRIERAATKGASFGVRMSGDSMVGAGILNGDYVLFRRQSETMQGQIALVLLGDAGVIKKLFRERDYVRLSPANDAMAPILVRTEDFKSSMIVGVAVAVFRRI